MRLKNNEYYSAEKHRNTNKPGLNYTVNKDSSADNEDDGFMTSRKRRSITTCSDDTEPVMKRNNSETTKIRKTKTKIAIGPKTRTITVRNMFILKLNKTSKKKKIQK